MTPARARTAHLVVAAVAWFALVFQLVLVLTGEAILVEEDPPGLAARTYRYFAYFTIQSNLLVAVTSTVLARDPEADRPWWRVARTAAVVGITVTGVVHFFLLRPLLDLDGAGWAADKLLHIVAWTLVVGQVDGWVPYPFLDASEEGWGQVAVACVAITVLFLAVFALHGWLDRRLRPAPGGPRHA